jgi:hypothetical protein
MKIFIALLSIFCFSFTFANANEASDADADANNLIIDEMPTDYLEFANVNMIKWKISISYLIQITCCC